MKKIYEAVIPPSGWSDRFTFSPGVRVGNLLYISGQISSGEHGVVTGQLGETMNVVQGGNAA